MSLYKYEKNTHYKGKDDYSNSKMKIRKDESFSHKRRTLWTLIGVEDENAGKSRFILPGIFVLIGLTFIYLEIFPQIQQMIQEQNGYYTTGNLSPVSEEYIDLSKYVSHPKDLAVLAQNALSQHVLLPDDTSINFKGTFYISIPSIGIEKMPVKANVDSTSEDIYNQVLNYSLAHFRNTGLPISNVKNNIVIYGHSASPTYNPKPTDPMVAFSFLPDLKVGDDIYIEIEGKTYNYKMYKSSIVEPTDSSIITGIQGKGTLTLFTCFPLGSDAKRYVAVARPVS